MVMESPSLMDLKLASLPISLIVKSVQDVPVPKIIPASPTPPAIPTAATSAPVHPSSTTQVDFLA